MSEQFEVRKHMSVFQRMWQWLTGGEGSGVPDTQQHRRSAAPPPHEHAESAAAVEHSLPVLTERLEVIERQLYILQQHIGELQFEAVEQELQALRQEVHVVQVLIGGQQMQSQSEHQQAVGQPGGMSNQELETIIQNALGGVEKQISRAGREQLKANSLAETQIERLTSALELLKAADARREAEMSELRQEVGRARATARLEVVQGILPALDGLDEAVRSGYILLGKASSSPASTTIFDRLRERAGMPPGAYASMRNSMHSWLIGLTFVRQRLLNMLEAEGVTPIAAQGKPFDPQLHVVLNVVPATDDLLPGMVASELRRGYMAGTRVLRHAEVTVAKATTQEIKDENQVSNTTSS